MKQQTKLTRFKEHVLIKYQIYNSIFTTLPFDSIRQTGVLLPLFQEICEKGFADEKKPLEIVTSFYTKYAIDYSETEKINLLFQFVQYIERQIVLFDAIEEAAFPIINNLDGFGSIRNVKEETLANNKIEELQNYLKEHPEKCLN